MKTFQDQSLTTTQPDESGNKSVTDQDIEDKYKTKATTTSSNNKCPFIDLTLLRRYVLLKKFNTSGAFGKFFIAHDLETNNEVLVKIQTHLEMNSKEYEVLQKLNQIDNDDFPKLHCGGEFVIKLPQPLQQMSINNEKEFCKNIETEKHSFLVVEKLGQTLQHHLYQRNRAFSLKTVCQIGIRLIELIKRIHDIGLIYNDLKLDNILIGNKDSEPESLHQIRLIDFGLTTPFLDQDQQHIKFQQAPFTGNLAFSSKNAMNYKSVSRRDDLISLTYLLLYVHQGRLEFLNIEFSEQTFQTIAEAKNQATPESLCQNSPMLLQFVQEIHNIQFEQEPDYHKLQFILLKCMLDHEIVISQEFDWSIPKEQIVVNQKESGINARISYFNEFNQIQEGKSKNQDLLHQNEFQTLVQKDKHFDIVNNYQEIKQLGKNQKKNGIIESQIHRQIV